MVSGLTLREGHVGFAIEVDPTQATVMEPVRRAAEKAVMALPGVLTATVVLIRLSSTLGFPLWDTVAMLPRWSSTVTFALGMNDQRSGK